MKQLQGFGIETPKFHIVMHLLLRVGYCGNVRQYACWHDESLNKSLKACCRLVSQCRFECE
eukprot:10226486-Alexandrium_andersonii.AAC.1